MNIQRGDVHRLVQGTVLYIRSEEGLKIHAIFANSNDDLREPATEPYSSIQDMVLGFDKTILQATFKVSEQVIDELLDGAKPPIITHVDAFCRGDLSCDLNKKKKDKKDKKDKEDKKEKEKEKKGAKLFNVFEGEKTIENCNGWSTVVTEKQLAALEGSSIGLFVVKLKPGSMMEPHWNAMDTEVVVVLEGRGMVRVSSPSLTKGRVMRLEVEEGDVFVVPRFNPVAQMAFNNGSFVYMGFTRIMAQRSNTRFISGKTSVLQLLSKEVLQLSFNVKPRTMDELLAARNDTIISPCISCAEEEIQIMEQGEREEEGGGRRHHGGGREEEERRREEEEAEGRHGGREEGHHGGGRGEEELRREEEEAEGRHGGREEEGAEWGRRGEEEESEAQLKKKNHHHYGDGGRRIFKRN